MIGLIFDHRDANADLMRLVDSREVAERVGRLGVATVIVTTEDVEPNVIAAAKVGPGSRRLHNLRPAEIIDAVAPLWSLQQDQMIYVTADHVRAEDAMATEATVVRVDICEDVSADFTITGVLEILDLLASEYTAGLLEVRYILTRLAENAYPYRSVAAVIKA